MAAKDFYQVLGVARDAPADEIKQAFRRLAKKFHPDVSREADATERMAEVNEAYATLSDPERRAAYDAALAGGRGADGFAPPDWDAGFEFSHPGFGGIDPRAFEDLFGEMFGRGRGGRGTRSSQAFDLRGDDHHAKVVLDLEDLFRGGPRTVTLRSPRVGPDGRVTLVERTLDVKIPPGLRPGQSIRLAGQGGAGSGGAPAGDLLLQVQVKPHARFTVSGGDLSADLPVAPWEAALGGVIPVPMPDGGTLRVRVPAGAQSGRRLTVRGRGLPGKRPGDLLLRVRIVVPEAADANTREWYEKMAQAFADFDPRRVSS
jgi:curved DNA-binding protein